MRNLAAIALALATAGGALAADAELSVRPVDSNDFEVEVQPGGSFTVRVSLDEVVPGAVDLSCNANLMRLVLTVPGVEVTGYSAAIGGTVMRRIEDGRYAFVHVHQRPSVTVAAGQAERARELIGKAERDCFISASTTAEVQNDWEIAEG